MTIKKPKSQRTTSRLTSEDRRLLHRFHIPDNLITEAGIRRVSDAQARALGFRFGDQHADLSGRIYPYIDESGNPFNGRLRRDHPEMDAEGKPENKYISMHGATRGLYFPPGARQLLKDPQAEIVLVEAETSALAGAAYAKRAGRKYLFVAMGGCWGWRDKEVGALADLDRFSGRKVHILLDSNVSSNQTVQKAELKLASHLATQVHAADVRCYRLPAGINGPDDFLEAYKDWDFKLLFDRPAEPWLDQIGESYEKYLAAKPPTFLIKDFLQSDGLRSSADLPDTVRRLCCSPSC